MFGTPDLSLWDKAILKAVVLWSVTTKVGKFLSLSFPPLRLYVIIAYVYKRHKQACLHYMQEVALVYVGVQVFIMLSGEEKPSTSRTSRISLGHKAAVFKQVFRV